MDDIVQLGPDTNRYNAHFKANSRDNFRIQYIERAFEDIAATTTIDAAHKFEFTIILNKILEKYPSFYLGVVQTTNQTTDTVLPLRNPIRVFIADTKTNFHVNYAVTEHSYTSINFRELIADLDGPVTKQLKSRRHWSAPITEQAYLFATLERWYNEWLCFCGEQPPI